jgi:glutamyl-tRNA synthetase
MDQKKIRVRFAPSPTGGLHLGGVRTVLYNYLFAKRNGGSFILRIEDTDQTRFVEGAEQYIYDCLKWCGLEPDESPVHGGEYGPYRQSERKPDYKKYAEQLVESGDAYYAFDTPEELDLMRQQNKTAENPSPQYDRHVRGQMKNSISLGSEKTKELLDSGTPHVVRIKMPEGKTISFTDMIHGYVSFESSLVDDKVLLKADGMPTYHLAVVVDDYLMKISHAFRGEEWLSSAPVHVLLWEKLFGIDNMPQWAHLPLILGPNGKLSKRDGAKYGFPVFAMNWLDKGKEELTEGFREKGFLPEAFINLLALLGWNDGTEQELFSKDELIEKFSMDRVHKAGAKFDFEKARWFNHEWLKKLSSKSYIPELIKILSANGINAKNDSYLENVVDLVKDRCHLLTDFIEQAGYFFNAPKVLDTEAVLPKWNDSKKIFFEDYVLKLAETNATTTEEFEIIFKNLCAEKNIKPGELQLPFRIMLVGAKFGPGVFVIAEKIGKDETISRINYALTVFNS